VTVRSGWLLNPGQTRQDTRLSPVGTFTPVDAVQTRSGVVPGGTPMLLTGSGMTGSISTGRAIVQGTPTQGAYPVVITAAEPITVANGHPSLPRIDSVFLVAYDQLFDTSGQTLAAIAYVQGTAATTPTAPTAPPTGTAYLRLWDILVPAGASAGSPINWSTALTDRRTYTTTVGGITPDGATAGAYPGQYRDGNGYLERYNGSSWESRVYLGPAGQVVIGTDTNLFRDSANVLRTNDSMTVDANLSVGGIGGTLFARRGTDQQLPNSTTFQDDNQLQVTVAANATYEVTGVILYSAHQAAGLKLTWAGPSGATFDWTCRGQLTTVTGTVTTGGVIVDRQSLGGLYFGLGGADTTNNVYMTGLLRGMLVTGATAGTFKAQWSQYNSNSVATIMRTGAHIILRRLA
jgi:hypothetical protein